MFHPKLKVEIISQHSDVEGRLLICNVKIDETVLTICNLYAPNHDNPKFFKDVMCKIEQMSTENIIIGGDFNLVMNPEIDRYNSLTNHNKSLEVINAGIQHLNLTDVWQDHYPEGRRYSWFRKKPEISASRIDFFLVNQGLRSMMESIDYSQVCRTDHAMVTMNLKMHDFVRGPGVWKLNTKVLADEDYCTTIRELIKLCKADGSKAQMTKTEIWEYVKLNCTSSSQKYCKEKSIKRKCLLRDLYELQEIYYQVDCTEPGRNDHDSITLVTKKIEELELEKVKASAFRVRCDWQKYGCKSTKYFFALEKRQYNNKTMFSEILDNGTVCKSQKRILEEQNKFYQKLYSKDPTIKFELENGTDVKLTDEHISMLKKPLTKEEVLNTLKELPNGKVCGTDGLPIEFYKVFANKIMDLLFEVFLEMYEGGIMTRTMRHGVMSLIPKKAKDSRYIKNLRPLTLLNLDFKILAKAVANRLKIVLPDIVKEEQTGFMMKRQLHDNVRKTMDVIAFVTKNNKRAVIVNLDFEKCFDRIEHEGIFVAMCFFSFPECYIKWIQLFFNNMQISTQNAGDVSPLLAKREG